MTESPIINKSAEKQSIGYEQKMDHMGRESDIDKYYNHLVCDERATV